MRRETDAAALGRTVLEGNAGGVVRRNGCRRAQDRAVWRSGRGRARREELRSKWKSRSSLFLEGVGSRWGRSSGGARRKNGRVRCSGSAHGGRARS